MHITSNPNAEQAMTFAYNVLRNRRHVGYKDSLVNSRPEVGLKLVYFAQTLRQCVLLDTGRDQGYLLYAWTSARTGLTIGKDSNFTLHPSQWNEGNIPYLLAFGGINLKIDIILDVWSSALPSTIRSGAIHPRIHAHC